MIKKSKKGRVFLILAIVFSFLMAGLNVFASILVTFNVRGVADEVGKVLNEMNSVLLTTDLTMVCIEMLIIAMIDIFAGIKYLSIVKHGINPRRGVGYMFQPAIQILCGSFVSGILAMIGIMVMAKDQMQMMQHPITPEEAVSDYKKEAMIDAVTRLKELKSRGAISEEEYYETLNKILEG